MKKIFKLLPAALGLVALTSCSSDDLFGDSKTVDLSDKIVVTVTEEGDITRAYRDADQKVAFETGDQLRVYDSKLQAYDNFEYSEAATLAKPTFILSADKAQVAEKDGKLDYAYAVFGSPAGDPNVSYAGWRDGYNIALMKIEPTFAYKEDVKNTATGDNQVVYRSTLPQFGTVTPATDAAGAEAKAAKSFDTSLKWLTGRAKVVFENGAGLGVKKVKMTAYRFAADGDVIDNTIAGAGDIWKPTTAEKTAIVDALKASKGEQGIAAITAKKNNVATNVNLALMGNKNKNLSGWFEAVLDPTLEKAGLRDITDDTKAVTPGNGNSIEITVADVAMLDDYTNVFFFPVVTGTYDVLLFEYSTDGTTYKVLTAYSGEVTRGQKLEGEDFTKQTALVTEYDDVTTIIRLNKLIAQNATANAPSKLVINADHGVLATGDDDATLNTITLPQLKNNMVIDIQSVATDITENDLNIVDAAGADNSKYTVTFNFNGFAAAAKKINLNTTAKIVLGGTYTNLTAANAIEATKTGGLSLGSDEYPINVAKVKVTDVTVTKGNVTTIDAKNVTVAGGTITTINQSAAGTITVNGGTVNDVKTKGALNVVVGGGTVANLHLVDAAGTITMTGGKIAAIKKPAEAITADHKIEIKTSGDAIINTENEPENFTEDGAKVYKYTYETTFNDKTAAIEAATLVTYDQANIYTAAQLAAVGKNAVTAYNLKTKVTFGLDKKTFAGLTLPAAATSFAGNNNIIDKLPAALFQTLSTTADGLTISNLTLSNATVKPAKKTPDNSGYGVLANTITGAKAVNITNVMVSGAKLGLDAGDSGSKSINYGLIAGYCAATGAVTITDCGVNGTVSGYYNLGGYIGNVANTTHLTITKTAANIAKNMSAVTFVRSFTTSEDEWDNAGTYGNFVGSFTLAGAKFVLGDATNATEFSKFFSADKITSDNIAGVEKIDNKSYVGMAKHEIGLSLSTALTFGDGASKLYGKYQTEGASAKTYVVGPAANDDQVVMVNIYE